LLLNESVTELRFKGTRCTGIRTLHGGMAREFHCAREVIVAAGGLGSAKLLMLSGVGNADDLRALGIAPVVDLKGVGQNFQDHPLLCGVVFKYKGAMPPRAMTSNAVEAAAYLRSSGAVPSPDIKMVLQQLPLATPEIQARYPLLGRRLHDFPCTREALQPRDTTTGKCQLAGPCPSPCQFLEHRR
jgi:choline dehydrogenase